MQYKFNEDIFASDTDVIVNSVNCVGMMGKGIALEFKKRFPQMYEDYRQKCLRHEVQIGKMDVYLEYAPVIINFPTKTHWKEKSSLEYIEQGLMDFAKNYRNWNIRSVAFPQLGCANGGLNWRDVGHLMDKYLKQLADLDVVIYVNNVSNLKSKIEQSMKALDLQDLQLVLEFAGNLAKFKKQEILAAYNRLDKGDQAVPTDRLLCLNGGRSEFFKYLEDAMGHELSDEEKFVVLLKLLKHQKTREVADKIPKKGEKWQIQ